MCFEPVCGRVVFIINCLLLIFGVGLKCLDTVLPVL